MNKIKINNYCTFKSFGMWCVNGWVIISVLRDHNAFKTLITTHPKTHSCHISEDLIPHEHCCENLKFHIKETLYHTKPTYLKVCSSPDYLWRVIVIMTLSDINLKIMKRT